MALKYSRQRQVIKDFLMTRKDHPTADVVYMNVKREYPNISLGTVYRNLSLLANLGEIQRLQVGDGIDHFDADTSRHYHVVCTKCGSVTDLAMDSTPYDELTNTVNADFEGIIEGHVTYFYGICGNCHKKL
ncbi:MAG: transcriptional repressor [Lachnospiraceae bacterium]|nr:transcriptional repressor [Lachnospiraceae bacterium]